MGPPRPLPWAPSLVIIADRDTPTPGAELEAMLIAAKLEPAREALGLEPGGVRVGEYDARWPALFAVEAERIRDALAGLALRLEHVGSTSVPGLCAKPVLDMAAGLARETPLEDCVAALQRVGYEHCGERGVPGRQFFRRGQPRAFHLHLVEDGGRLWCDYLLFRDGLRADAVAAARFGATKRALAARFANDRAGYTDAKAPHVEEVLRRARGETR